MTFWQRAAWFALALAALGLTLAVGLWIGYSNVHTCVCGCITAVT